MSSESTNLLFININEPEYAKVTYIESPDLDSDSSSDSICNVQITKTIANIIKSHYDKTQQTEYVMNKIKEYSLNILKLIVPILLEDEEIIINLKCSKANLNMS